MTDRVFINCLYIIEIDISLDHVVHEPYLAQKSLHEINLFIG